MELTAGTVVGPYEIKGTLGAGGMGEVYRASDSRLGRDVALKILPAAFAADPERLRRFEQEARATGGLSHSNILAIFDIGVHAGSPYIVSELLEGETLRDRLQKGALSLRKSLDYGAQVAAGLAAAHERGIIHRDLKPENIFICSDDRAKILDFGLAKLSQPEPPDPDQAATAAVRQTATQSGAVLGTVGYMSPEQLRAQPVDHRSDIFSFGAVLYEMLSGQRAFRGTTPADISSAILKDDPAPLSPTMAQIPPVVDHIVHHCLEKTPGHRFQSARDLAFQLQSVSGASSHTSIAASTLEPAPLHHAHSWLWIAATTAALLLVGFLVWRHGRGLIPGAPPYQNVAYLRLTDFVGLEEWPAISPDGKAVAFTADHTGTRQIWVRLLAGGPPLQITQDAGEHLEPRWSQDSSYLFYFVPESKGEPQGTLWQVPALGGPPRQLASSLGTADVSHDGKRLAYFRLNQKQVELVTSDLEGANQTLVSAFPATFSYLNPRWSPDDKTLAYEHSISYWTFDVYTVPASGGKPVQLTHDGKLMSGLAWLPDGSGIVYSSGQDSTITYLPTMQLWVAPLDGSPHHRITYGEVNYEMPDISRDGKLTASARHMNFDIWKFPIAGDPVQNVKNAIRITNQTGIVQTPSISPDGRQVAFISDSGGHGNIWVEDLAAGALRQITSKKDAATIGLPLWSPDGKSVAFAITGSGIGETWGDVDYWVVNPDGSNLRDIVKHGAWASWSPDSRWIYYTDVFPEHATVEPRLWKVPAEGGQPIVVRSDGAMASSLSADGSTLYFLLPLQNENGIQDYDIRVAKPENGPARTLAHVSGTRIPTWQGPHPTLSPDGKWLALPLNDNLGTNLWLFSTSDGQMGRVTDFGDRRTYIARRVSWSSDSRYLVASVGDGDSDVVEIDGILPASSTGK
jgi:eukaryotic-like serine/threonine-protein kinase